MSVVCEAMFPVNAKCRDAIACLDAFESAEHDINDSELGLKWNRVVRTAIDSLIVGDVDKYITAENGEAVTLRLLGLRPTFIDDDMFARSIDEILGVSLGGAGLWAAPLNAEQIQHAIRFGISRYGTAEKMKEQDAYDVYIPDAKTLATIATVYGRIAAYAGQASRLGEDRDPAIIEQLNFNPTLREHFGVRLISSNRKLVINALDANGSPSVQVGYNTEAGAQGQYNTSCYFRNPNDPTMKQQFEISIPQLFGRPKTFGFIFDFSLVH